MDTKIWIVKMHKGKGNAQQIRGDKRSKKQAVRKLNKHKHEEFILHLILKHGKDFDVSKLKQMHQPGQTYWEWYLNA